MPNTIISVYLSDDEYVQYVKDKEKINNKVRDLIKKEVS